MLREGIISVSYVNGMYVCDCAYASRYVPKAAKFYWSPRFRAWVTMSAKTASGLIKYCDEEAKVQILEALENAPPPVRRHIVPAPRY